MSKTFVSSDKKIDYLRQVQMKRCPTFTHLKQLTWWSYGNNWWEKTHYIH